MGQNRVKILRVFTVLLCSVLWRRDAHTVIDAGELVHASTIVPRLRRLSAALILSRAWEASPPFRPSSPSRSRHAELGLDAVARRAGQPSPPQPDSAHPNLPSFALDLLHPSPRSAAPKPGRNRAPDHARHRRSSSELRLSVELPPTAVLRPKSSLGELPRTTLDLPDLFPAQIRRCRRRFAFAPPRALGAPRAHAAGRPARAPRAAAARPATAGPRRSCPRRLTPPPPPAGPERPRAAAAQPRRRHEPRCARALARRRGLRPRLAAWAAGEPRRAAG